MTTRKSAAALSAAEGTRYLNVITQLINSSANTYGKLVAIHGKMSYHMHDTDMMGNLDPIGQQKFLPWHRKYLLKLEQAMQAVDPASFIPYWDWTTQRKVPPWIAGFTPTVKVPGHSQPITVTRNPGVISKLPTPASMHTIMGATDFTSFTAAMEDGPHNSVHMWVNGTISDIMVSPTDPLFWMHHAQIDRLWSLWQTVHPGLGPTLSTASAVLKPWAPTTAASVSSIATLGYSYV